MGKLLTVQMSARDSLCGRCRERLSARDADCRESNSLSNVAFLRDGGLIAATENSLPDIWTMKADGSISG